MLASMGTGSMIPNQDLSYILTAVLIMLALTGTDSKISNQELYIALGLVLFMLALKKDSNKAIVWVPRSMRTSAAVLV